MIPYKSMKFIFQRFGQIGIILGGFLFFFACASAPSHIAKREVMISDPAYIPSGEIRILTINVWSGLTYKGFFKMGRHPDDLQGRYELLVPEIRKLGPDIIAIQEANPFPRYAKRLAADLDYQVIYRVALGGIRFGPFGIPTNMREGGAILVKKPWTIEDLGKKRLGGKGIVTNGFCFHLGETTQASLGKAVVEGKSLYIYNVHLHSSPFHGPALNASLEQLAREMREEKVEEAKKEMERGIKRRRKEIANLMKFIEETLPPGMPAIVLGDFNTTFESGELTPFVIEGKWIDSFKIKNPKEEGVTWDPQNNPNFRRIESGPNPYDILVHYHETHSFRIDFILVNNNIPRDHILESQVVLTPKGGLCPSDHYGVLTTLKW